MWVPDPDKILEVRRKEGWPLTRRLSTLTPLRLGPSSPGKEVSQSFRSSSLVGEPLTRSVGPVPFKGSVKDLWVKLSLNSVIKINFTVRRGYSKGQGSYEFITGDKPRQRRKRRRIIKVRVVSRSNDLTKITFKSVVLIITLHFNKESITCRSPKPQLTNEDHSRINITLS